MQWHGVKLLDPVGEALQLEWLVLPANECPDETAEKRVTVRYFRRPHDPWGPGGAFVDPVTVRRTRTRVLFCQRSGLAQ